MAEEKNENKKLPVYLVLDSSASMAGVEENGQYKPGAFDAALEFLPRLYAELIKGAALADMLRIEVIMFDSSARPIVPLSDREQLEKYLEKIEKNPIVPNGDATHYGAAFLLLRTEIERGVQQLQSEGFGVNRPVVFFITDGAANDDVGTRSSNYKKLTEDGFLHRPNLICVGVGTATRNDLKEYGASRYKTGQYTTGNEHVVFVAGSEIPAVEAIMKVIPALLNSILVTPQHGGGTGGVSDVFGDQEDIFDDVDDDWGDNNPQ